jgi:hypothetical protein
MAIIQAVTGLASAFDIAVTAEGAENIEQVLSLIEVGCDEIQGYAIAKPMPSNEMSNFILNFTPDPRWKIATQTFPSKTDFELLLAETNHKYWIEVVIDKLSKNDMNEKFFEVTHKECKFGRWFEKIKKQNIKITPNLKNLDLLHQQIHKKAHILYEKLKKEKRVINSEEKKQIFNISNELIALMGKIKKEYEKEKKHISLAKKILNKREQYGQ